MILIFFFRRYNDIYLWDNFIILYYKRYLYLRCKNHNDKIVDVNRKKEKKIYYEWFDDIKWNLWIVTLIGIGFFYLEI